MDWSELYSFSVSPLELVLRGTLMYWFLFTIFRFILRRDIGTVGISDFLFVAIVADAAQNAMSGDYKTVADGFVLVGTLVFWNYSMDYASFKSPFLRRFLAPPSKALVRDGKLQLHNMRREFISSDEVHAKMREEGIEDLRDIKEMRLEADGSISVIKKE